MRYDKASEEPGVQMSNREYEDWKLRFKDAQSLMISGAHETACSSYLDALRIAETGCVSSTELADTLEGLAATKMRADSAAVVGDLLDRAETARQHALDETIVAFGDDDLETAKAYYKFAFHNIIRRRRAIAISYFEKTLSVKQFVFGELHFEVANTLMIMGGTHPEEPEKTKLWQRACTILQHLLNHPDECDADFAKHVPRSLRGCLENLATQAFREHRIADAEKYFRRALATCTVTDSKQSCSLCNAPTFGKVLLATQNYGECETFLTDAITNGGDFTKRTCSEVLADLYDETDRPNKAKALRDDLKH